VFSFQLLVAALVTGAIYALIALVLNLIYGTMRLLNVAHGDLVMLGAYAAFWSFSLLKISPLIALPFIGLLAAGIGAIAYLLLFQRFLRAGARSDRVESNSLLAFFGLSIAIENLTSMAFTGNSRAYQYLDFVVHIGEVSILGNRLAALIVALALCTGLLAFFRFTTIGLAVRAIIQSREAAQIVGVDVHKVYLLTFSIGFGVAGMTGALISLFSQIWPFMGFSYTVTGFVVIILGGLGNIYGSVIGGLLLGVLETFGVTFVGANYRSIMIYGVFIVILIVRPQGLLGAKSTAQ
jgi:branched-chain amino acid transport system permease protein